VYNTVRVATRVVSITRVAGVNRDRLLIVYAI
jgi:hypothetical protein